MKANMYHNGGVIHDGGIERIAGMARPLADQEFPDFEVVLTPDVRVHHLINYLDTLFKVENRSDALVERINKAIDEIESILIEK